jgi:DNA excision repair protein ERCC-3
LVPVVYARGDRTLLVTTDGDEAADIPSIVPDIAELLRVSDQVLEFELRDESLWQSAALGRTAKDVLQQLKDVLATPMPHAMQRRIWDTMSTYGQLKMDSAPEGLVRVTGKWSAEAKDLIQKYGREVKWHNQSVYIERTFLSQIKQEFFQHNIPVQDRTTVEIPRFALCGEWEAHVALRPYQREAIDAFLNSPEPGNLVVLPCGSGKTLVGVGILLSVSTTTLIVVPNRECARQWQKTLLDSTTLVAEAIGVYGETKNLTPITLVTYSTICSKRAKDGTFRHLENLLQKEWGLVIYDEVHQLPAPLFRLAALLCSSRRLGLTATLVREDGRERDVYSLIGPKCYSVPWRHLERNGFLSPVSCFEVRVSWNPAEQSEYEDAPLRQKHQLAAKNPRKLVVLKRLLQHFPRDQTLILGQYVDSLQMVADMLGCPMISGSTKSAVRSKLYDEFRSGRIQTLILSRVGNLAIDLPSASLLVQLSGLFSSRQEEAQRLGRILRPCERKAHFFTLVSHPSIETSVALHRQRFLVEQGYQYQVLDEWVDLTPATRHP